MLGKQPRTQPVVARGVFKVKPQVFQRTGFGQTHHRPQHRHIPHRMCQHRLGDCVVTNTTGPPLGPGVLPKRGPPCGAYIHAGRFVSRHRPDIPHRPACRHGEGRATVHSGEMGPPPWDRSGHFRGCPPSSSLHRLNTGNLCQLRGTVLCPSKPHSVKNDPGLRPYLTGVHRDTPSLQLLAITPLRTNTA